LDAERIEATLGTDAVRKTEGERQDGTLGGTIIICCSFNDRTDRWEVRLSVKFDNMTINIICCRIKFDNMSSVSGLNLIICSRIKFDNMS
jgi:hypothetical protein